MKLRKGFVTYQTGEKQLMVAAGSASKYFKGLVKSNDTAAFIIDNLKEETTVDKIVESMTKVYDVSKERAYNDVNAVIDQLRGIGAIDE